jgi:signal transduction histidine kinase
VAEYAGHITEIAHRASDMLRQLVDAARSEPTKMVPLDLPPIIQHTFTLFAPRIRKQGIHVAQDYPPNLPQVMGRADQLEQVFINLALNAFDAMPNGGDFIVTLAAGAEGAQPVGPGFVTAYVKDTGPGIPAENINLLFEPFFTTKAKGAGSGLGLFVTHLIINQHGGAIEVESPSGAGTTFIIKLPTANNQEKKHGD